MSRPITHNATAQRFELTEDGVLCVLDYEVFDGTMTITHTGVPRAVGGRGIAADLTRNALETARNMRWTVRPQCSYAAGFISRNPDYRDLVVN